MLGWQQLSIPSSTQFKACQECETSFLPDNNTILLGRQFGSGRLLLWKITFGLHPETTLSRDDQGVAFVALIRSFCDHGLSMPPHLLRGPSK